MAQTTPIEPKGSHPSHFKWMDLTPAEIQDLADQLAIRQMKREFERYLAAGVYQVIEVETGLPLNL